jgi:glycosyltransferase involved in cell wall biosynthesis
MQPLNILVWHVHGSWMSAFVRGRHRYLLPVMPNGESGGRRPEWPASVRTVTPDEARTMPLDVVVFQRAAEVAEARLWLGEREPGRDLPAIYLEHNAPQGRINEMRHPMAGRGGFTIVHVTYFNALFWDVGSSPSRVIEHGIPDPGYRYTGELPRCAVVINEAARRQRVTGTDLLPWIEQEAAPIDLFGIGTPRDLRMNDLHREMALRRVYVHPYRWTSLGLALLEAMTLGMPIVALATTEAPYAVPPSAGIVSNRPDVIRDGIRWLIDDAAAARALGRRARAHALEHYGLERFLGAWDRLFAEVMAG